MSARPIGGAIAQCRENTTCVWFSTERRCGKVQFETICIENVANTRYNLCGNPTFNGLCSDVCKMTPIQVAAALVAMKNEPYCPVVDERYCQSIIGQYIPDHQLVRYSTPDRVCILKNAKNELWELKVAQPKDGCTSTLSLLNGPALAAPALACTSPSIVSQDFCQKVVSTQNALSEYQYETHASFVNPGCNIEVQVNMQLRHVCAGGPKNLAFVVIVHARLV